MSFSTAGLIYKSLVALAAVVGLTKHFAIANVDYGNIGA